MRSDKLEPNVSATATASIQGTANTMVPSVKPDKMDMESVPMVPTMIRVKWKTGRWSRGVHLWEKSPDGTYEIRIEDGWYETYDREGHCIVGPHDIVDYVVIQKPGDPWPPTDPSLMDDWD